MNEESTCNNILESLIELTIFKFHQALRKVTNF